MTGSPAKITVVRAEGKEDIVKNTGNVCGGDIEPPCVIGRHGFEMSGVQKVCLSGFDAGHGVTVKIDGIVHGTSFLTDCVREFSSYQKEYSHLVYDAGTYSNGIQAYSRRE